MNTSNNSIRPEDILADDKNTADINGMTVRKGSIAAFLKNIDLIEVQDISKQNYDNIIKALKELAPAVVAAGLYKHATFKNPLIQQILMTESKNIH